MGMTMTQKILAAHAGLDSVTAGQLIEAKLDVVMANDITGPMALPIFRQMADKVFDKDKVVLVPDHFTPNKDIKSAENSKSIREFAKNQGLSWYFEQGKSGVEHAILPEAGVVAAGECIIGADSHTCTYGALGAFSTGVGTTDIATGMAMGELWFKVPSAIKFVLTGKPGKYVSGKDIIIHIIGKIGVDGALYKSMEFTGDGIKNLSMADRFTMANMAIEAGAKNGIFPVDEKTEEYLKEHIKKEYIMEEVFPDFIILPISGSNSIMWQEISGRRRSSKGRFLLPAFLDTDIDATMVKLFGRFRWELCRTIQGTAWNNIQVKSLTSEYSDFVQFYRKNRELSEDKKDKLKMQIQKCRNNTREVFVIDYENWIKHEAHGGLLLSKPVREIMATYCPFAKDIRDSIADQPLFRDAMARFNREIGKKTKEYDLKFRVWDKDKVDVPQEIVKTRDFYVEM